MKVIEFFGPPCSGKSYYRNFLHKKFPNLFISSEFLIIDYSKHLIHLSYTEKLTLKYFKFIFQNKEKIKSKRIKKVKNKLKRNYLSSFFVKNYRNICNKIFLKFKEKDKNFISFYRSLVKLFPKKKKHIYDIWFKEVLAKIYIAKQCKFLNKIVLFDEGIIQRISFLIKNRKRKMGFINNYLNNTPKPDFLVYLDNYEKNLILRSKERDKKFNEFMYKDHKEIKDYKKFFRIVYKQILKSGNYIAG